MTWHDGIAAVALTAFALLILTDQHKHRSTTEQTDPQDGEPRP
ncbi:hypothetical protein OIA45_48845 (plasmid) [Streptomyces chartreusis]|nr:hypothetical protein OIA45_48845 [Streptomyces chartreusis]